LAADLGARPVYNKAPMLAPTPIANWTGFYLGGNLGVGWTNTTTTLVDATPPIATPIGTTGTGNGKAGVLGGVQLGYNYQVSSWLFGLEGEFDGADLKSSQRVFATQNYPAGSYSDENVKVNWLATITGRLGYVAGQSLFYVKGGAAFTNATYSGVAFVPGNGPGTGFFPVNDVKATRTGYTVGAGFEQMFMTNWSWKVEYDYAHFGTYRDSFFSPTANGTTVLDLKTDIHALKAGVNYHFNAGPIVAKY
jgi:outer membrane immunogenic protein